MVHADPCPDSQSWKLWLAGEVSEGESTQHDDHLARCSACRSTIDTLTDDGSLRSWMAPLAVQSSRLVSFAPPAKPGNLGRLGRYEVEYEVAQGGMGIVYRAMDTDLRRPVALKILRSGRDDGRFVDRFLREARAAAKLRHDHVLPIHGVEYTSAQRPVLVMPFVDGPTLKKRITDERTLPPREAAIIVRDIARGLQMAHQAGLVHRDVKPGNILLDSVDSRAKLTDFGLAREIALNEGMTTDGTLLGTLEYMSPEQVGSPAAADAQSDIYSLGATLYECLTGVPPFRGTTTDLILAIERDEPVEPRTLVRSIPRELNTICLKAMAKERSRRYATSDQFADDLERWLRGEPVLARPAGRFEKTIKWMRRRPTAATVIAGTLVLLVCLTVLSLGLTKSLNRAERAEATARLQTEELQKEQQQTAAARLARDQVNDFFLKDLLQKVDPAQQDPGDRRADMTVRELLDRAAIRLDQSTGWEPTVEGTLRAHIGHSYFSLSRYPEALSQFEKAAALNEKLFGANDERTLVARGMMANLHFRLGDHAKGIEELQTVLKLMETHFGERHRETCRIRNNLAILIGELGQFSQSIELHRKNLQIFQDLDGFHGLETLQTASSLGVVLAQAGQFDDAEKLLIDTVRRAESSLGKDHLTTLLARSNLAGIYDRRGLYAQSIPVHRDCEAQLQRLYGNDNPRTLIARGNTACALFEVGQKEEAISLLTKVLADCERARGANQTDSIVHRSNLAAFLQKCGDLNRAISVLETNEAICTQHLTDLDPKTIITRHNLANCLRLNGRQGDAIALWESKVLPAARQTFGPSHPSTLNMTRNWIRTLESANRNDDALRERKAILELERSSIPADDPRLADCLDEHGEALLKAGSFEEAEAILREAFAIQKKKPPSAVWTMHRTQLRLGQSMAEQGRMGDARPIVLAAFEALCKNEPQVPASWKRTLWADALNALTTIDTALTRPEDVQRWQLMKQALSHVDVQTQKP